MAKTEREREREKYHLVRRSLARNKDGEYKKGTSLAPSWVSRSPNPNNAGTNRRYGRH